MVDKEGHTALCAGAQEDREERARSLFRSVWDVPKDTYVTDGFPMLLYKLSRITREPVG